MLRCSSKFVRLALALRVSRRCWHTYAAGAQCQDIARRRSSWTVKAVRFVSTEKAPFAPEEKVMPDISKLPRGYLDSLSQFIQEHCERNCLSESGMAQRVQVVKTLQQHLRVHIPDATLQVFGSTRTGMCLASSDIDVSFYSASLLKRTILPQAVIRRLYMALQTFPEEYCEITSVAHKHVRVPICKVRVKQQGIRIDISCNNEIGVINSQAIRHYLEVDKRVAPLAIMLKSITKVCSVSNSRERSLSSYTYQMLLIYYLQRTDPPVLPNLQRLWFKTEEQPECPTDMRGSFDAYYFNDIERLDEVWDGRGRNQQTTAELLFGFFKFYTEFDFGNVLIAPRLPGTVYIKDSQFAANQALMTIEDPFRKTFNLGIFLTEKVMELIQQVFKGSCIHLAVPCSGSVAELQDHFFSPYYLMGRGQKQDGLKICRKCSAEGDHFTWECGTGEAGRGIDTRGAGCASSDSPKNNDCSSSSSSSSSSGGGSGDGDGNNSRGNGSDSRMSVSILTAESDLLHYAVSVLRLDPPAYTLETQSLGDNDAAAAAVQHQCSVLVGEQSFSTPGPHQSAAEARAAASELALTRLLDRETGATESESVA